MALPEQYSRLVMLYGEGAVIKIRHASVLIFGVGGVGGYVAEALARMGIGRMGIVDNDRVSESNINRQIIATHETVGRLKTDCVCERVKSLSPDTVVECYPLFYLPENAGEIDFSRYDYIVDAIDTVKAKVALIERAKAFGKPVISAMGAGNKLNPMAFRVADIEKTKVCPLARVMRSELRRRGIRGVKAVYSEEEPVNAAREDGSRTPGSNPFCPPAAGLLLASEVVKDLMAEEK